MLICIYYNNFNKICHNLNMPLERNSSHTCTRQNTPSICYIFKFIPVFYLIVKPRYLLITAPIKYYIFCPLSPILEWKLSIYFLMCAPPKRTYPSHPTYLFCRCVRRLHVFTTILYFIKSISIFFILLVFFKCLKLFWFYVFYIFVLCKYIKLINST